MCDAVDGEGELTAWAERSENWNAFLFDASYVGGGTTRHSGAM